MRGFRFWGLVPAWALMLGTLILPVGIVILVSVAERGAYGGFQWGFSLASYREILFTEGWDDALAFDPKYLVIIGRTIAFAAPTTAICVVIAVPIAYVIANQPPRLKAALIYLVTLPFWVSMIVRVYAWLIILGNDGLLGRLWRALGGDGGLLFTPGATLVGMVYSYVPLTPGSGAFRVLVVQRSERPLPAARKRLCWCAKRQILPPGTASEGPLRRRTSTFRPSASAENAMAA